MDDQSHQPQAVTRVSSLDALRGLAILGMVLAGAMAFGVLPSWMYHAQTPPPTHEFNLDLPGITWVDLVFPFFLFAHGQIKHDEHPQGSKPAYPSFTVPDQGIKPFGPDVACPRALTNRVSPKSWPPVIGQAAPSN